ncbi:MAG TPA: hypothetical protein VK034_26220 [Enhygromyxa sp.]|nr:hypothetical protein [Enhygromyxa sp.]
MATAADRCLLRFVPQIRPKRPSVGARTTAMFEQLRTEALAEGIELIRFAYAGSIEKGTGLRRYRDRECSIPGQAVDLVVEIAPGESPTHEIYLQLEELAGYCFDAAGQADELDFRRDRLRWRLLPILAQRGPDGYGQWLVSPGRADRTSVRTHTRDVRERTRASIEQHPSVGFNDCVRLLKWWLATRPAEVELPSFVVERLAIAAYDQLGVHDGFAATLAAWAERLAELDARGLVDPAGEGRPLLAGWSEHDRDALARWFADGAGALREARASSDPRTIAERLGEQMFGPALVRAIDER